MSVNGSNNIPPSYNHFYSVRPLYGTRKLKASLKIRVKCKVCAKQIVDIKIYACNLL